jgi:hypothetical protein
LTPYLPYLPHLPYVPTYPTYPTQRAEGPTHSPSLARVRFDASYGGQARPNTSSQAATKLVALEVFICRRVD